LQVKVHYGPVICGPIGCVGDKRIDVYGETVNLTALLTTNGFSISAQAFRQLGKDARTKFKKHTPPYWYIPVEEGHK
jgi:class 3 adenylate cyclase